MVKKLYNKKSKEELVNNLNYESFKRITCSFYNYTPIENPEILRDNIYSYFESLNIFTPLESTLTTSSVLSTATSAPLAPPMATHQHYL